jgi:hypothetical protein
MIRYALSVCALSMLVAGPALAVGASCEDQLASIKDQITDHPDAPSSVDAKYTEAKRLCSEKKDMEAQALAREIQEQLAQKGAGTASGSSSPTDRSSAPKTDK